MQAFLPTIILRHRKENVKKCSLKGLKNHHGINFLRYPSDAVPDLSHYVVLSLNGPELSEQDSNFGLFLIDSTWAYSKVMLNYVKNSQSIPIKERTLPSLKTAYPRKQTGCDDPDRGLASIEALYCAYSILDRPKETLLDSYYWKDEFLSLNYSL